MKKFTAVVEKCSETGLYVGYAPGFPGVHSQGESLDKLQQNLQEVISMILEDGEPEMIGESSNKICQNLSQPLINFI